MSWTKQPRWNKSAILNFKCKRYFLLKQVRTLQIRYTLNAKTASERFKDRPMSPAQSIDYWTRYVIRHKGAPHLKSHALNLTWYQYYLLDVILVSLTMVLSVVYSTFVVSRIIYRHFCLKGISNLKYKPEWFAQTNIALNIRLLY